MKTTNIITNGLTIPMIHGIQIGSKQIKTAKPSNPYWKSYSIGYYINNNRKVMVYFSSNNQFAIIKNNN